MPRELPRVRRLCNVADWAMYCLVPASCNRPLQTIAIRPHPDTKLLECGLWTRDDGEPTHAVMNVGKDNFTSETVSEEALWALANALCEKHGGHPCAD